MESNLRIRDTNFHLHGEALAGIGLSIYQALSDLLSERHAVRIAMEHDVDGVRTLARMVLTPGDVELRITGAGCTEVEVFDDMVEDMKSVFAERGRFFIPHLQDAVDRVERGSADDTDL